MTIGFLQLGGERGKCVRTMSHEVRIPLGIPKVGLGRGLGCLHAFLSAGRPVCPRSGAWWLRTPWGRAGVRRPA